METSSPARTTVSFSGSTRNGPNSYSSFAFWFWLAVIRSTHCLDHPLALESYQQRSSGQNLGAARLHRQLPFYQLFRGMREIVRSFQPARKDFSCGLAAT